MKWPAGTCFLAWRKGFQLSCHSELVQHTFTHHITRSRSCDFTACLLLVLSCLTAPEEVRPNWLISRKDWYTSKISGNKSILKTCSMPYNSIGDNKISAFPFWSLFSYYTVSHCSFSQEKKSSFIQVSEQKQGEKWTKLEASNRSVLWSLFESYNLLIRSSSWNLSY